MKTDRQIIYETLLECLKSTSFLTEFLPDSDERKAEFMIEKRKVREELLAVVEGKPVKKKKVSTFNMSRYKTHDGDMEGNPTAWKKAAKKILNVNDENCLATLGLSGIPATEAELKSVWRSLMRKNHPDSGGSEDEAAKINAAYELALSLFYVKPSEAKPSKQKRKDTGLRAQLQNPIDEEDAEKYLKDDDICEQEKKDGKHLTIKKQADEIIIANKQGMETTAPDSVIQSIKKFFEHICLDGELIGKRFYIYDLLEYNGQDLRLMSYHVRYTTLTRIFKQKASNLRMELHPLALDDLIFVPTYFGTKDKTAFFFNAKDTKKEGVVFKRLSAPFTAGRPAEGGDMLKVKFWATLSAIVAETATGKDSFVSYVFDTTGERVYLGHCSAIGKTFPQAGEIVELKYLYAMPKTNKLIQQVYLDIRDDVSPEECTIRQLKYKRIE